MAKKENIEAQERMGDLINEGKLDQLDEIFAADVFDHDPAPGQAAGPTGFRQYFGQMRRAFPT